MLSFAWSKGVNQDVEDFPEFELWHFGNDACRDEGWRVLRLLLNRDDKRDWYAYWHEARVLEIGDIEADGDE